MPVEVMLDVAVRLLMVVVIVVLSRVFDFTESLPLVAIVRLLESQVRAWLEGEHPVDAQTLLHLG